MLRPLVLSLLALGCAHADPPASAARAAGPRPPPPAIEVGDSGREVRARLGPDAVEELLSPTDRAISLLYGDPCAGDPFTSASRGRTRPDCGTARLLRVTLHEDRVISVQWLERPARRK